MDFPDYVRLLRRGWRLLALFLLLGVGLSALYLVLTPKDYEASASLLVTGGDQQNVAAAAQAAQVSNVVAENYAAVIQSQAVLRAAATELQPQPSLQTLQVAILSQARESAAVIDITATSSNPRMAAIYANAVAAAAISRVPGLAAGTSSSAFRLVSIEQAAVPSRPSAPSVPGTLLTGLILGMGLGLIVIIVRHAFDKRLRRPEDVIRVTDTPVLGLIPRKRGAPSGLALRDDPSGPMGEALRSLRTSVAALDDQTRRSLVFAPIEADVESGFVPLNLAWSIAQSGRSVLLIDGDMRQSPVETLLGLPQAVGLGEILKSGEPYEQFVRTIDELNLGFIASGEHTANPSDLLSSSLLTTMVEQATSRYDYVVINAPPVLAYTDAALVSRAVSTTVLVGSSSRTTAEQLQSAEDQLRNLRSEIYGIVLIDATGANWENRRLRRLRRGAVRSS